MADQDEKRAARDEAHDAGVRGASKMTAEDAREAAQAVRRGEDPEQAKREAKND